MLLTMLMNRQQKVEENIATGSVLFQEWLMSNHYMPLQQAAQQQ